MSENIEVNLEPTDGSIPPFLDRRIESDTEESRSQGAENTDSVEAEAE